MFNQSDLILSNGAEVSTKFEGAHVAAVKDPAYGIQKAQIKGKCNGSSLTCDSQLAKVQASVTKSDCEKFLIRKNETSVDVFDANIDQESLDNITVTKLLEKKNCSLSDKSSCTNLMTTIKKAQDEEEKEEANLEELEEERKECKEEQSQEEEKTFRIS